MHPRIYHQCSRGHTVPPCTLMVFIPPYIYFCRCVRFAHAPVPFPHSPYTYPYYSISRLTSKNLLSRRSYIKAAAAAPEFYPSRSEIFQTPSPGFHLLRCQFSRAPPGLRHPHSRRHPRRPLYPYFRLPSRRLRPPGRDLCRPPGFSTLYASPAEHGMSDLSIQIRNGP